MLRMKLVMANVGSEGVHLKGVRAGRFAPGFVSSWPVHVSLSHKEWP